MKLLFQYLKHYKGFIFLALILAAINQIFALLDPYIFQQIIDRYVTQVDDLSKVEFLRGTGLLLIAAITVAGISRLAKNFQDYYVNVITQRVGARIYANGISHSLELPYSVFEDQRSGETLEKLQRVRIDIEKLISSFINILFPSFVGLVFVIIYAISVHWIIAPAYLIVVPCLGILSSILSRRIKTVQSEIIRETTGLAGATTESLRNIELVKSLGLSNQEINRLNNTTDKILNLELKKVKYVRSLSFIQGTCVNFLRTCIIFLMLYLILTNQITVGQFFTLYIYSFFIFGPLQQMGDIINIYRETEVSLEYFEEILGREKEKKPKDPKLIGQLVELEFKDVGFNHLTSKTSALNEICFKTKIGETVAFVGPSGAGKTTLVKLLLGLYRPTTGIINYNGIPENEVDYDEFRNQIGLVTQDTHLFSGSIRENLLFVAPDAKDEMCLEMLNKAACSSLLSRVDNGLDSIIGEGGVKVSGGEKQRLSIARALLRNPRILIFDEATSALDSLTEEEINTTIRELSKHHDQITILIAHRLSTVMHADMIYVLEKGCITERGTHDNLLEIHGLYYAMWRQQIGERKSEQKNS